MFVQLVAWQCSQPTDVARVFTSYSAIILGGDPREQAHKMTIICDPCANIRQNTINNNTNATTYENVYGALRVPDRMLDTCMTVDTCIIRVSESAILYLKSIYFYIY